MGRVEVCETYLGVQITVSRRSCRICSAMGGWAIWFSLVSDITGSRAEAKKGIILHEALHE